MLHRRLARDYEILPASSAAMIHIAMTDNVSKRITHETTPTWRGKYQGRGYAVKQEASTRATLADAL